MIVKCIKTREEKMDYDFQFLSIGKNYLVYGIFHDLNKNLSYLITSGDDSTPYYAPSTLFTIEDGTIPTIFRVSTMKFPDGNMRNIISYTEMSSYKHHKGLIEQDIKQMKIFIERKKQIDEELSSNI